MSEGQKQWIVPIPGLRKLDRLDENLGAVKIEMTARNLDEIRSDPSHIKVVGDRYYQEHEKWITGARI